MSDMMTKAVDDLRSDLATAQARVATLDGIIATMDVLISTIDAVAWRDTAGLRLGDAIPAYVNFKDARSAARAAREG